MNIEENKQDAVREKALRKKRVKRMKKFIVLVVFLMVMVPIISCIGMMVKIGSLETKVNAIIEMHNEEAEEYEQFLNKDENKSSIIYAAELEEETKKEKTEKETQEDSKGNKKNGLTYEEKLDKQTESKKVYLTFDDGPGQYTDELLDVLAENEVKATFFVVGRTDEHSLAMYKRIAEDGHTLAMHSYSHQYNKIYKSVKAFDKDFTKLSDLLYETTGERATMYRFPGGSSNQVSNLPMSEFISYLNDKNITYYDWNVINGDATGKNLSQKQMIANVMNGVRKNNNSMVLMHDSVSKDTTVKSLPALIKKLKKEGYVILPITKYTNTVQHVKSDSVEK